jgi:hypothetical protein
MEYLLLATVIVVLTIIYGRIWLRRREEATLRREVRAQPVIFRIPLEHVKIMTGGGWRTGPHGEIDLIVRSDAFEVSCSIAPARVLMGLEYYFKASETTLQVCQIPFGFSKRDWIVITGRRLGEELQLAIAQRNGLRDAWTALIEAGAVPIGPPPQEATALAARRVMSRRRIVSGVAGSFEPSHSSQRIWSRVRVLAIGGSASVAR